ncbi:hypothetical protein [Crenobacter cavernae]|uniref:YaiO family outer membrane beta-barrel protein n=1 Tax=Crenobacter cavernae TaxID=2290923 RepID=A0A345Y7M1_9NEIS|nr:hypothetical protein [Crenobacter cavernae]AXK39923.1 hypothetical protein DWG20_10975 [Crenobacter cavernae]
MRKATRWLAAALLAFIQLPVQADENPLDRAAGAGFLYTHDSDGFTARRLSLDVMPDYASADAFYGARLGDYRYSRGDWSRHGEKLSVLARHIDPATGNGWQLDAGVFGQGGHTLLTLDGSYHLPLTEKTALEVFINRDWVETPSALDAGVAFTFVGASLDQIFGERWTGVGLLGQQYFSDGNRRDHGRLKLIYQPWLDTGLTVQARYRAYHSSDDGVAGAYFNPKQYWEAMLAVGWRKRFENWTGSLTAGVGQEKIDDAPGQTTRLFEAAVQSPVRAARFVRLRGGYNQSASFQGPSYHYRYLQGEWLMRF